VLDAAIQRVLGSLVEKLSNACIQTSLGRPPVGLGFS
jgi:hypothetical protein